jgi:hypothetical protein
VGDLPPGRLHAGHAWAARRVQSSRIWQALVIPYWTPWILIKYGPDPVFTSKEDQAGEPVTLVLIHISRKRGKNTLIHQWKQCVCEVEGYPTQGEFHD